VTQGTEQFVKRPHIARPFAAGPLVPPSLAMNRSVSLNVSLRKARGNGGVAIRTSQPGGDWRVA
jgi:hypothetical protein